MIYERSWGLPWQTNTGPLTTLIKHNILIDKDGYPLLSGFGFSYASTWDVDSNEPFPERYTAPERSLGPTQRPTKASDIYSLGLIFSEVWKFPDAEKYPPAKLMYCRFGQDLSPSKT